MVVVFVRAEVANERDGVAGYTPRVSSLQS